MKTNTYCSVFGCRSWRKKNPDISFFHIPKGKMEKVRVQTDFGQQMVDRHKYWVSILRFGKKVTPSMRICSLHFVEDDFFKDGGSRQRRRLKKTAVPSRNLPVVPNNAKHSTEGMRSKQLKTRAEINNTGVEVPISEHEPYCENEMNNSDGNTHTLDEYSAADGLVKLLNSQPCYVGPKTYRDFEVQVNTPKVYTVSDLITTDKVLFTLTGLQNFKVLDFIINCVNTYYRDCRVHRLSIKNRVILTFLKMKCDLSYTIIALLFGITSELCRTYFLDMLKILSQILKPLIVFPCIEEIRQNIPICFNNFVDTQIVLDCTEIFIQNPKCLCCRIRFYSHYKSTQTVKFMTGVSPAGLITFVSEAYGGRASDKFIFENSNLIQKIDPSAAIMVDKGFLIDNICAEYGIKVYRPPFLKDKRQLTPEDAIFNKDIAAARVHVERTYQRIKLFKILSNKLQWSLVKYVDDIFIVAAAVTNLSSPILSADKFM